MYKVSAYGYKIDVEIEPKSETGLWKDYFLNAWNKSLNESNETEKGTFNTLKQIIEKYGYDTSSLEKRLNENTKVENNQTAKAIADELEKRIEVSRIGYKLGQVLEKFKERSFD
jgi:hypothetical protein